MTTQPRDARCPRCGFPLVDGVVRPGTSRWDDKTDVCAWCSEHEAMQQALDRQVPGRDRGMTPREKWWDVAPPGIGEDWRERLLSEGSPGDQATREVEALVARARDEFR